MSADKKTSPLVPDGSDKDLEQRVDAMMSPEKQLPPTNSEPEASTTPAETPAIDSFADNKTAPEVSSKLLKEIGIKPSAKTPPVTAAKPAQPITIADAEAAAMTEPETDTENLPAAGFDDARTDQAVDDIVAKEGDAVLAAEDAKTQTSAPVPKRHFDLKSKLRSIFKRKRTWFLFLLVLVAVFAVPVSRYALIGLVYKRTATITVIDSKTNTPVSNADVVVGGTGAKTNANGTVKLKSKPGNVQLKITKRYYKSYASTVFIGLSGETTGRASVVATGRQVPVTVLNKITGKPLAGAEIKVLGTTAKTNASGKATIVLPVNAKADDANLSHTGYNGATVAVQITDRVASQNIFRLVPSGRVYFLSNLTGSVDVVRTNLDGGDRHTVLPGTGKEDSRTTSLLASRDWRYLVLKAKRDAAQPSLYLIDTQTDKVTQFDSGNADFSLIGWYGHSFLYDIVRNDAPPNQSGREAIKSYDADNAQLNQLDQNQAEGSNNSYAYQGFYNFYLQNGIVVYNVQWYTYDTTGTGFDLGDKNDTIRAAQTTGTGKKDYQTVPAKTVSYIQAALYEPQGIYYGFTANDGSTTVYEFEDKSVKTVSSVSQDDFNKDYPTYLLSPDGESIFWSETRDGKNTLFAADDDGKNRQQLVTLSDYAAYGWYGDYLLVSKGGSELYAATPTGLKAKQSPLKITDYYKPAQTYQGYGYGYGGL